MLYLTLDCSPLRATMLTGIRLPKDLQNHISKFPLVVGPLLGVVRSLLVAVSAR